MFDLSLTTSAILILAAFLAGIIDSIAGGGGLVTVPALLLAGLPPVQALAANKVQGFALQKLIGVPLVLPALALFLPEPWGSVAAIVPTSWPAQLFWQLQQGRGIDWGTLLVGLLYQALLIALLLRRLARQAS